MEYYKKYLKYKSKYMSLKNHQIGGSNIIISDDITLNRDDNKLFTIMYYNNVNDTIKANIESENINIDLKNNDIITKKNVIYKKINYDESFIKNFNIIVPTYILQIISQFKENITLLKSKLGHKSPIKIDEIIQYINTII
jgi:hypothetical protein